MMTFCNQERRQYCNWLFFFWKRKKEKLEKILEVVKTYKRLLKHMSINDLEVAEAENREQKFPIDNLELSYFTDR